ncbi:MAG: flagellar basal body-associated FliL family protein [Deltaproteobacteria bacterium]|nr:flagellar basal body-associated FliL family protein [Deltaproteobacteria bacterium]
MAGDKDKNKGDVENQPAKSSPNKILFIIIGVLVLVILGGGGYFIFGKKGGGSSVKETEKETASEGSKEVSKKETGKEKGSKEGEKNGGGSGGEVFVMEPFVVNLQDSTGTRYLKVTINFELEGTALEEAKIKTPQVRDAIIILLSSKAYADVGNIQGKYQLRDEIVVRINQILTKGKLKAVYFTEFVIQ